MASGIALVGGGFTKVDFNVSSGGSISIPIPAGSKHMFSPATTETTVTVQTTLTLTTPITGYIKYKKGTVTAV